MEISEEECKRIKALLMATPVDRTKLTPPAKLEISASGHVVRVDDREGSDCATCGNSEASSDETHEDSGRLPCFDDLPF